MFKKLKNKKGFTLVELIVVLVILAILAALLVPALTGYIDKAREQSLTSEASMVLTAAQATVSEAYGKGDILVSGDSVSLKTTTSGGTTSAISTSNMVDQINQLAEVKSEASWTFSVTVVNSSADYKTVKIGKLYYSDGKNAVCYDNGTWGSTIKNENSASHAADAADKSFAALMTYPTT